MLTEMSATYTQVFVHDGDRTFKFPVGRNQEQHFYTNIPVSQLPTVEYERGSTITPLAYSDEPYTTPKQQELNKGMTTYKNVHYRSSVRGTPRGAIITFPAYKGDKAWATPYSVLLAERFDLDNMLYISFQDRYLTAGSYFLSDNFGNDPVPAAVEVITGLLEQHGLTAEDASFVGSSKGANIAALVSQHFEGNQLVLCNYTMDIHHRIQRSGLAHLEPALEYFGVDYPDALAILKKEFSRKETHWLYSIGDKLSNQGYEEQLTGDRLTTYASSSPHGAVLKDEWDKVRALVSSRFLVH